MNRARAAILIGKTGDEGLSLAAKRPRADARRCRSLDDLILRQERQDRDRADERHKMLFEIAIAAMPEERRASALPCLSVRQILGSGAARNLLVAPAEAGSLTGVAVKRQQPRVTDTRREERRTDLVASAVIDFRGRKYEVRVLNTSRLGLMIEAALEPLIAEPLLVHLDTGESRIYFVRWVRGGRIGLGCREEDLEPQPVLN